MAVRIPVLRPIFGTHNSVPALAMTPQARLATSATHLDDAVEHLTFDRFDWSLESLWRAVAALGEALAPGRRVAALPPIGVLPAAGTLNDRTSTTAPAEVKRIVATLEALRATLDDERLEADCRAASARIERLVFDASDALLEAARSRQMVDPGAVYGSLMGAWDPNQSPSEHLVESVRTGLVSRRAILQLISAGAAAAALAACAPPRSGSAATNEPTTAPDSATATASEVAPASVRAVTRLDAQQWPTSDPFLFCAYHVDDYPAGNGQQGPAASLAGRNLGRDFDANRDWRMYHGQRIPGFPRHPHRGFETVTVVRTGRLDHADSLGAAARFGDGDVQWLTAGGGIQHAEMFPLLREDAANPLEFFQIWMNLPAADKMVDPYFTMIWSEDVPRITVQDDAGRATEITIAAGRWADLTSPSPPPNSWASREDADVAIWTLKLDPGAVFELPPVNEGTDRSLYLHRGNGATVADRGVGNLHRVEVDGHGPVTIEAGDAEVEILLMQGRPIGEPVARRGPFVMNTQQEIEQAYGDYRLTRFGGWPWTDDDPVHDVTRDRFAIHPDGTVDEPA